MIFKMIKLEDINPYDHIHFRTMEEWLNVKGHTKEHLLNDYVIHLEGVLWAIRQITRGYPILPILVTGTDYDKYQRRDGFKRYMAYKCLGHEFVPCLIASEEEVLKCPQEGKFYLWEIRQILQTKWNEPT